MPKAVASLFAFNRGEVSSRALPRVDLQRMRLSAEQQLNWIPRVLGRMMLRPGWQYLGGLKSNVYSKFLPFIFSTSDTALVELSSAGVMRLWIDDELLARTSVSSAVSNGNFTSNLTGWTDADETGATSSHNASGYMQLVGTGYAAAIRQQEVTVAGGDQNVEHALRIEIERGPVTLRVGSSAGDDDYIAQTSLETGSHSLAFTPTGNFFIEFSSLLPVIKLVDSVAVESAGTVELATPWTSKTSLKSIRKSQSGDVIFIASSGFQQRRIERRAARSWSIVLYKVDDGPFRVENTGTTTISSSALSGNVTLTASKPLFRSGHVGSLYRITSAGQRVEGSLSGEGQETGYIRVTGIGPARAFTVIRSGTWSATVTLQRSIGEPGAWTDWLASTGNTAGSSLNDGLDNQIVYYRYFIKTGDYTSGTADIVLEYDAGSIDGVVRITDVASSTSSSAEVLTPLGGTTASAIWAEGAWSSYRGFPTSVALYEGRLWWAGKGNIWGSVSDAYASFDENVEGDSGPISRSIGEGPVDNIVWLLPLQRLILGAEGSEISVKSSSIDEPLSPTNFALKSSSTQGTSLVPAEKIDMSGVMAQRGGTRVLQIAADPQSYGYEYATYDMTLLKPEMCEAGIEWIAVQRQPDTRIHVVLSDGTAAININDRLEDVSAWIPVETDGLIEDIAVLPGSNGEDQVYYAVARTVNGGTVRYLERWALESECVGGTLNKQADSFVTFTNSPAGATVTGLTHLVGESVIVWADGKCLDDADGNIATFTVNGSGEITLTDGGSSYSATTGIVGLAYEARYKSRKLAEGAALGTALNERKKIDHVGVILANTHHKGLKYGSDFTTTYSLPAKKDGKTVADDTVFDMWDEETLDFGGSWDTDSRLCLLAQAPRPATVLGVQIRYQVSEKA